MCQSCVPWLNIVDLACIKLQDYLMHSMIMDINMLIGILRASFPFSYLVNIISCNNFFLKYPVQLSSYYFWSRYRYVNLEGWMMVH
jgi:hypothetical protein